MSIAFNALSFGMCTEAAEGKEKWGVKERALMASAGARAYNGGLGAKPP